MLLSFGVLAFGWYELSGGADFKPGTNGIPVAALFDMPAPPASKPRVVAVAAASSETVEAEISGNTVADTPVPKLDLTLASANPDAVADAQPAFVQLASLNVVNDISPEPQADLREVSGNVVNMRNGPGTRFSVLDQLRRGDDVEVVADPGEGWVKLRVMESNRIGWMSDDFLRTAVN
ncbi:hypothetical protein GCM10011415_19420 [Salipiger pallidus]|uniref:SH3b domain-containing protein n=2 Tax=Salipiger pallidus TaxID=1775170 RepID=A0A8J2ZJB7_9RHOB|nr:hypothetical protein GCM10011415_19420 [Salipiger pallidus]